MNGAVHGDAMTTARTPDSAALTYWLRADQPAGRRRHERRELEHARQVERQHEEQQRETGDDRRRLQLEAPAELLAGGAQDEQQIPRAPRTCAITPAPKAEPFDAQLLPVAVARPGERSALSDSTGNTHGIRLSTMPPMNANTSASASESPSPAGDRRRARFERRRLRARRLRARDDGADQRHIDRHRLRRGSPPLAKPLPAVTTPATRLKSGRQLIGDRQRQHERAVRIAHERSACRKARSGLPGTGRNARRPASAAPAGAVSVTTTFCPSPRAANCQPGTARGSASRVAAMALAPLRVGVGALGHGQREVELRLFRNARLLADQPFGFRAERRAYRRAARRAAP